MTNHEARPKVAFWFRYGAAEHAELFHALPELIEELAQSADVHFFGYRDRKPVPPGISAHATLHPLPFSCNRQSPSDKLFKTLLWIALLPWIGLRCRRLKIDAVYIDETIPLAAGLARLFFGPRVAISVADFFVDIYLDRNAISRWIAGCIRRQDLRSWSKLPLVFTRARNTRDFLSARGVPRETIVPVYDPCDFQTYFPTDQQAARAKLGIPSDALVLVHHGILHPNKGNDFILRALPDLLTELPHLHFLLIGDGPDMGRLQELRSELKLEDAVTLTGWLPEMADVNLGLNTGDIGLVMRVGQKADDFHMTGALVHAMACGLPILAANLKGVAEVIEPGVHGLLFDPTNPRDFQDRLRELAGDPETRDRMGAASLAQAQTCFSMETAIRKTVLPLLDIARTGSLTQPYGDQPDAG